MLCFLPLLPEMVGLTSSKVMWATRGCSSHPGIRCPLPPLYLPDAGPSWPSACPSPLFQGYWWTCPHYSELDPVDPSCPPSLWESLQTYIYLYPALCQALGWAKHKGIKGKKTCFLICTTLRCRTGFQSHTHLSALRLSEKTQAHPDTNRGMR